MNSIYEFVDPRDGHVFFVGRSYSAKPTDAQQLDPTSKAGPLSRELRRLGLEPRHHLLEICADDRAASRLTYWIVRRLREGNRLLNRPSAAA
ncbi:MAG: hypothetical protein AAF752_00120 [Bacteroidota bacterium]